MLGALGCWWLLLAQALTGRTLLIGPVPGVRAPVAVGRQRARRRSPTSLAPLVTSGALGIALVWGLAALVLPYLVRGRAAAVDLVMATAWAAGLVAGTQTMASSLTWPDGPPAVHGIAGPAILAVVVAVLARASRSLP